MPAGFHVPVGRAHLIEAEHAIDHRLDLVGGDGGIHGLESLHRADRNALDVGALAEDQAWIEFTGRTAQAADQANFAAEPDGTK